MIDSATLELLRSMKLSAMASELKKQLEGVKELRFIFTSPSFTTEKAPKEKREFYIPRLSR